MLKKKDLVVVLMSLSCLILSGCEGEAPVSVSMSFAAPRSTDAESRAFGEFTGSGVEVTINGEPPQTFPGQLSEIWNLDVSGIVLGATNSVFLRWFVVINNVNYDVATQTESFYVDISQGSHVISADHVSDSFDHDNDNVSNLIELNAGGFPVPAELLPEMIPIVPAACFLMGSPPSEHEPLGYFNELQTEVCNLTDFSIGRYEVTFEQYQQFALATGRDVPSQYDWVGDNLPVSDVRWSDARDYAQWLATITGLNYRLPTEAQWEYAARANTTTAYHTGETIDISRANYRETEQVAGEPRAFYVQNFDAETTDIIDGVFRLEANNQWIEYDIDRQTRIETKVFVFEEITRDADGILIRDVSRNTTLRLSVSRSQVLLIDNSTGEEGSLYRVVDGPNSLANLVGVQPIEVGSFPANAFGLHDVHGNQWEWTCSRLQSFYNGAEQVCEETMPIEGDTTLRMIKRGGSWEREATESRSANRGWNNDPNTTDRSTGFRVVINP